MDKDFTYRCVNNIYGYNEIIGISMKCKNHPKKDAAGTCVECGNPFCEDCITKVHNKNYCKECVAELLDKQEQKGKEVNQPQIVIQQQQQQQQAPSDGEKKFRGSVCVLILLLIIFFPLGIIYYFIERR